MKVIKGECEDKKDKSDKKDKKREERGKGK